MSNAPMYYVVLPSARLLDYLQNYEAESGYEAGRQLLLTPALFTRPIPRKIPVFWPKKAIAESKDVKITFLARLIERFEHHQDESLHGLIHTIIGTAPYSLESFDHWWELHPIGDNVTLLEDSLSSDSKAHILKQFAKTDDPSFDHWLEEIIQQKEK